MLFANDLDDILVKQGLLVLLRVNILSEHARLLRQLEYIHGGECTNLVKDWLEVFVSCRNLFVFLKTAFLQDAEEGIRLVDWLATAVQKPKHFQVLSINLVCTSTSLLALKSIGKQCFTKRAIWVIKRFPRWCLKMFPERSKRDMTLISALFESLLHDREEHGDKSAIEWQGSFKAGVWVSDSTKVNGWQVFDLIRHLSWHLCLL